MGGIVRDVDESRGAELAGSADIDTPVADVRFSHSCLLKSLGLGSLWYQCFGVFVDVVICGRSVVCVFTSSLVDCCFHTNGLLNSRTIGLTARLTP